MGEPYRPEIHGTRIIKSKYLSGVCAICSKTRIFLKNVQKDYFHNGVIENYKRMLITCYNIRLFNSAGKPIEICESCIDRLREASTFRKKVESAGITVYQKSFKSKDFVKNGHICMSKTTYSKTNENIVNKTSNLVIRSKEAVPQLWEKVKSSIHKSLPKIREKTLNVDSIAVAQKKESASYWGTLEDNHVGDNDSTIEVLSDGESSTTSEQMKIATGYWKELEIRKQWTRFIIPRLDFTCTMCPVCSEKFDTHMKLFPHYENHFPNFVCHVCGLAYVKLTSFSAHMKMHSGIKYPCKLCNRQYASQNGVYAHIKAHHEKVKLFSCYECKERFCNSISRRRHLTTVHGIECPTHPCPSCGKIFFSGHTMRIHIKKTHQKLKNVDCPDCDMQFFDKRALSDHMAKHTGIKNYHCDFCGKAFCRKKSLTEHLKIHNNIKKHKCDVCEKAFVQKCALKSHQRIHTKDY